MQRGRNPFSQFGNRLQEIRRKNQESILEVSGAVELDTDALMRIEQGLERPGEDILVLLINHFDIQEDEADELWELAGYSQNHTNGPSAEFSAIPTMVVLPADTRIVYTDTANVTINNFGVVMNFMQNGGNNQPASVARVGMSLEHAKSVLEVLSQTITQAEAAKTPKQLSKTLAVKKNKKKQA